MLGSSVLPYFDQDEVHEIHRSWRRILDEYPGQRIAVAEAWAPSLERLAAYVRPDELHQAFNFHFLAAPWKRDELRRVIEDSLRTSALVGAPTTWVLSNHDIRRHVTRYGGGERGLRRARAAALMMLALPGSAYLYQGEELGLEEVLDLPPELLQDPQRLRSKDGSSGRDGCRVPLPWGGAEPPYNFTPLNIAHGWLPAPGQWRHKTVEAQWLDASSTLGLYRRALQLRRDLPDLGDGKLDWLGALEVLSGDPESLLAFHRAPGFVCTVNVGEHPLTIARPGKLELASVELDGDAASDGAETVTLPPDSTAWWTVR
jgi:alpha-glucosidase